MNDVLFVDESYHDDRIIRRLDRCRKAGFGIEGAVRILEAVMILEDDGEPPVPEFLNHNTLGDLVLGIHVLTRVLDHEVQTLQDARVGSLKQKAKVRAA